MGEVEVVEVDEVRPRCRDGRPVKVTIVEGEHLEGCHGGPGGWQRSDK